jgi:hypothetical protein
MIHAMIRRLLVMLALLGSGVAVWSGSASAAQWSPVPLPANRSGDVDALSCVSSRSCFVLGSGLGFVGWNGARLSVLPSPGTGAYSPTTGLACPSLRVCMSVGPARRAPAGAARFSRRRWSSLPVRTDLGPVRRRYRGDHLVSELTSVSCPSNRMCIAVGGLLVFGRGIEVPIIERWNGTQWQPVPAPMGGASLTSVSCASTRSCVAVGSSARPGGHAQPVAMQMHGRRWSSLRLPVVRGFDGVLNAVSCRRSGCVAVGFAFHPITGGGQIGRGLVIARRQGGWTVRTLTPPADTTAGAAASSSEELAAVSCAPVRATPCVAVGSSVQGDQPNAGLYVMVGPRSIRQSTLTLDSDPTAIDCPTVSFCLGGGSGAVERFGRSPQPGQ